MKKTVCMWDYNPAMINPLTGDVTRPAFWKQMGSRPNCQSEDEIKDKIRRYLLCVNRTGTVITVMDDEAHNQFKQGVDDAFFHCTVLRHSETSGFKV